MEKRRIEYLDFARRVAILFMIFQHAMLMFETDHGENGLIGIVTILLGTAPAAPVFMFIMGVFFSRKREIPLIREVMAGVKLILMGYLLNFLRFSLLLTGGSLENSTLLANESPLNLFLSIDILQMAGYSWIAMAVIKKWIKSLNYQLIIIVSIALLSPLLWRDVSLFTPLGALFGTADNVYFPLFPWIIYPLLGLALGDRCIDVDSYRDSLKKGAQFGGFAILIGIILVIKFGDSALFSAGDYHRSSISMHLIIVGFIGIWFWACDFFVTLPFVKPITSLCTFWSKNVTKVYFIQWITIGWSLFIIGANQYSEVMSLFLGVIVTLITHFILKLQHHFSSRKVDVPKRECVTEE